MVYWNRGVQYKLVKKDDDLLDSHPKEFAIFLEEEGFATSKRPPKHLSDVYYRKLMFHMFSSVFIISSIFAHVYYLVYKIYLYSENLPELLSRPWLVLLLGCECVYLASSTCSGIDNLLPPSNRPDLGLFDTKQNKCPTVDILIPCCREPTEVPIESIKAALGLDYPSDKFKVFVLDDGTDDDLRVFCEALQVETAGKVEYIRRPKIKGVPHHFKCGNMNYGMKSSNAEYVVMMDADMILHPSYLRRTLPHIVNSQQVAFVQIPQSFYNLPIGDPLNDSCVMGYNRVLYHRDSLGTAFCIGTGVVFRRACLDEIGGFQPQSITEDTMTSYVLLNQGYESVYITDRLQIGLTPWTFEGYVKQRERWGKGAIQQFAAIWRQCLGKKSRLNIVQKLLFCYHAGYYFMCFINATLAAVLLGALAFNWKLSVGSNEDNIELITYLALYLVLGRLAWMSLWLNLPQSIQMRNRDESHFWWTTPYFISMCITAVSDFKASFVFVPTSNIDRSAMAASGKSKSGIKPSLLTQHTRQLKHVKYHLAFVFITLIVVIARTHHAINSGDCSERFLVIGLSMFLICTCAHMLVPVMYILFPPNYKPAQRKSLIKYNADGVPQFTPADCVPRWSWTTVPYEILSWGNLLFWSSVLVYVTKNRSGDAFMLWCQA